jgi:hypothetical protein
VNYDDERSKKELKEMLDAKNAVEAEARAERDMKIALGGLDPATVQRMVREKEEFDRQEALARSLPTQQQTNDVAAFAAADSIAADKGMKPNFDNLEALDQASRSNGEALKAFIRAEVQAEVTRQLRERDDDSHE